MDFISTRGASGVAASEAILNGIAKDGGLYVPSSFPNLLINELESMIPLDYARRCAYIIEKFLEDYSIEELKRYADAAYSRFEGEPAPVLKLDDDIYVMELFHGPTYAFKDIALTLLPHLLSGARAKLGVKEKSLILVATSGDTGKAALEGFKDVEGTEIVVIYPAYGVSEIQKLQMQTAEGSNVHVIGIEGNFDDAQTAVKKIFASEKARKKLKESGYILSSANSINWGRLVPQIVYYISAYLDLVGTDEIKMGDQVNFAVPTGNFGNILAGYYAKRMGLPIGKLIVASNMNKVLTDFFTDGKYDANREFYKTMSPSMDILISSNLERLLFELFDRNPKKVESLMSELSGKGEYSIAIEKIRSRLSEFSAYFADEEETLAVIEYVELLFDYVLDPHTAVGMSAIYDYFEDIGKTEKTVLVSTASPYKFAKDVVYAIESKELDGFKAIQELKLCTGLDIPSNIARLPELSKRHETIVKVDEIEKTIYEMLK